MGVPGEVSLDVGARMKPSVVAPQLLNPPGGLHPIRAASFTVDEYRMMAGWPVPVPDYDIRVQTLVSATGEVLTGRESPSAVVTGAHLRWIADEQFFDETALTWTPIQGADTGALWRSSVEYLPTLINDYEYRLEDERFVRDALNFDSDTRDHMWADFSGSLGGANGYTVIMVFSPNSVYGNNVEVPYNGLWCYGEPTGVGDTFAEVPSEAWVNFEIQGRYLYMSTDSQARSQVVPISHLTNSTAPTIVAMVIARPTTTVYVATGPSAVLTKQVPAGEAPLPLSGNVALGRGTGDVLHTADMALFDLGIYANQLSFAQIKDEFSLLSAIYGGDK